MLWGGGFRYLFPGNLTSFRHTVFLTSQLPPWRKVHPVAMGESQMGRIAGDGLHGLVSFTPGTRWLHIQSGESRGREMWGMSYVEGREQNHKRNLVPLTSIFMNGYRLFTGKLWSESLRVIQCVVSKLHLVYRQSLLRIYSISFYRGVMPSNACQCSKAPTGQAPHTNQIPVNF